ncbi:MAG: HlyD family secretion protein [Treponema sp.]|nr:HlyD family secretion protein [Treponema sp.]
MKGKPKQHVPFRIRIMFLLRNWIWLFWIVLLPVIWIMLPLERLSNPIAGYVSTETENVGAMQTVRIRSIYVTVGQHVEPGDVLVETESFAEQQEKLNALDYTIRKLSVQQNAQDQDQNIFSLEMRTRQLMEDTRVELAQVQMNQTRDTATLEGLKQELAHLEPMVAQGLISDIELTRIRPQITALTDTLTSYPALISTLNTRLASARDELAQIAQFRDSQKTTLTDAQQDLLGSISDTIDNLEQGKVAYLFANSEGIISHIPYNVGDIVPSGTPIVRSTSMSTVKIMGLLRPYQVDLVHEGMVLSVVRPYRTTYRRYYAEVTTIEPEIMTLDDPFITFSRSLFPSRGRRIILTLQDDEHDFIPGESVTIMLPPPTFQQKIGQLISQIQWNISEKKTLWE